MTELRNRVVQLNRFGDASALEVVDAVLPTAGHGEVRVHVLASSLQYTDVLIRRHLYPQTARRRPPFVMGYDVIGEIDQLGARRALVLCTPEQRASAEAVREIIGGRCAGVAALCAQ